MKRFLSLTVLVSLFISALPAHADYFSEEIVGADPEVGMIREIVLNPVSFNDGKEQNRYNKTAAFVSAIENEAVTRFESGEIPLYRQYDIITNLDSFVYTMNQYFAYQKRYEQTRKNVYKESARSYLEDSKGAYARLKFSLKNSAY